MRWRARCEEIDSDASPPPDAFSVLRRDASTALGHSHAMSTELQVRGGRIRLTRLGGLNHGRQDRWDRAPERYGMWAFPYGFAVPFYYAHQWADRLPKRLRSDPSDSDLARS